MQIQCAHSFQILKKPIWETGKAKHKNRTNTRFRFCFYRFSGCFVCFFPRASERRVLPIVGVCLSSSHLHIFSSSHLLTHIFSLHTFSSSHLLIFTSSHLHIFSSSHLLTSHLLTSHLHMFTSSHLHIFTSSAHLHIFSSSYIFSSSHPHIFTSSPLALLPSCPLLLFYFSSEGGGRGSANETARNATLSHETRFDRQKLR